MLYLSDPSAYFYCGNEYRQGERLIQQNVDLKYVLKTEIYSTCILLENVINYIFKLAKKQVK